MSVAIVDLVIFAAQAGIRLAQAGRQAYVEATIGGSLAIPLPPAFPDTVYNLATNFANALRTSDPARYARDYKEAVAKYQLPDPASRADGTWRIIQQYLADVANGLVPGPDQKAYDRVTAVLAAVNSVRQFERGKSPFPSAVQRIGGTLVEITVDYYLHVPGALRADSNQGKAVRSFLQGLDDVQFNDARWDSIAISLFTAGLDTFKDHPELVAHGRDDQSVIRTVVSGISSDIADRLKAAGPGNLDAEDNLKRFGQVVLRSVLRNSVSAAIGDPSRIGVTDEAGQALITSVGSAFLELLVPADDTDLDLAAALRRVASTDGLDALIRAALKVPVEHPELFDLNPDSKKGLSVWLQGLLKTLYDGGRSASFFDPELYVDVARAAIESGVRDLPLLLPQGARPGILLDVASAVLATLSAKVGTGNQTRLDAALLSRADLKDLFAALFTALASHSRWFTAGRQLNAAAVVPLLVRLLADLGDGNLKVLLRGGYLPAVVAAVLSSGLLKNVKESDADAIVAGVDAVLKAVWKSGAANGQRLLDEDTLLDLLTALANSGAADKLFGGKADDVAAVVDALIPLLTSVRQGQTPALPDLTAALKNAA